MIERYYTGYLALSPEELKAYRARSVKHLRHLGVEFDAIAVRGISGALLGSLLSLSFKKPLWVVRKPGEGHSTRPTDGIPGVPISIRETTTLRYLILDDLLCTGETVRAIYTGVEKGVEEFNRPFRNTGDILRAECVGVYFYRHYSMGPEFHIGTTVLPVLSYKLGPYQAFANDYYSV